MKSKNLKRKSEKVSNRKSEEFKAQRVNCPTVKAENLKGKGGIV